MKGNKIKTFIVDDEYLTRKGLILTLPWEKYGMEIVGEAENAAEALDFLKKNPVDLVFTDITMPGGNGLELIRAIREAYRKVYVVVITCHKDFDLIQNAMRLGAMDYIVKTELEEEALEESFERIRLRIQAEEHSRRRLGENEGSEDWDSGIFLRCRTADMAEPLKRILAKNPGEEVPWVKLGEGQFVGFLNRKRVSVILEKLRENQFTDHCSVTILRNVNRISRERLNDFLYEYEAKKLFFQYREGVFEEADVNGQEYGSPVSDNSRLNELEREWSSPLWTIRREVYEKLCEQTQKIGVDKRKLKGIFRNLISEWRDCIRMKISKECEERIEKAEFWSDLQSGARMLAKEAAGQISVKEYSEDMLLLAMAGLQYIKESCSEDISQDEISRALHISRGYFSRMFGKIFGISYVICARNYRLEQAKRLLESTNEPVYKIAAKVGYSDERYFSRMFREMTGSNPTEYRNKQ